MPGATLLAYARNRTYSPGLGRWLQQDPNASGQGVIGSLRFHGDALTAFGIFLDVQTRVGNGLNLFNFVGNNPIGRADPLGLFFGDMLSGLNGGGSGGPGYDPFDIVDDYIATSAAQQAAFMMRVQSGFDATAHVLWQVAQLHPAIGIAAASYRIGTGQGSAWDALAAVPFLGVGAKGVGALARSLGWVNVARNLYGGAKKYDMATELHHLLPQQFEESFRLIGLKISEYIVEIPYEYHRAIHGAGGKMVDAWNAKWKAFLGKYGDDVLPSVDEVHAQLSVMMEEFGIIHAILKR
jgi:hypothetical protein